MIELCLFPLVCLHDIDRDNFTFEESGIFFYVMLG